jgi:hypothetical protein
LVGAITATITFPGCDLNVSKTDFLRRLVESGTRLRPRRSRRLFHLHHKPLYAGIAQADNRHRKLMAVGQMVQRFDAS